MRILALDLGKYKTVACDYKAETGRHRFVTVLTTPKALHDLNVDRARVGTSTKALPSQWTATCGRLDQVQ